MRKPSILVLLALSTLGTVNSGQCPENSTQDVVLPHPICSKFYQCVHGQKVERDCGPGTHFNPALKVCDWPANAGCEGSTTTLTTSAITKTTIPEETGYPETSNRKEGTTPFIEATPPEETPPPKDFTPTEETTSPEEITPPVETTPDWPDCDNGQMVERDSWPDYDNGQMVERDLWSDDDNGQMGERNSWSDYENGQSVERDSWPNYENGQMVEMEIASTETSNPSDETTSSRKTTIQEEITEISTPSEETTSPKKTTIPEETAPTETSSLGTVGAGNTEKCPMNENMRLPHPTCSKFYQCIQGQKLEKNCAPGTHFNSALRVCDYPEHAQCEDFTATSTTSAILVTTILKETAPTETSTTKKDTTPFIEFTIKVTPPEETTPPEEITPPEETTSTEEITPSVESTPYWPDYDGSQMIERDSWPDYDNGQMVERDLWPDYGSGQIVERDSWPDYDNDQMVEKGSWPDYGSGQIVERDAWPDYENGQIVEKETAPIETSTLSEETTSSRKTTIPEEISLTEISTPSEETTSPIKTTISEETASTETSNPSEETTLPKKTTMPEEPAPAEASTLGTLGADNSEKCPMNENVRLPHLTCSKFYQCIQGQKLEKNCAPGTHFNSALGVCDYPEHARCEDLTATSTTSAIPVTIILEETAPIETSTPSEQTTSPMKIPMSEETDHLTASTMSTVDAENAEKCFMYECVRSAHSSCSQFYQYIKGQKVEKNCPTGTHFNPSLKECDYPEHAGCEGLTTTSTTPAIPETTIPEETASTEISTPLEDDSTSPMKTTIPEETSPPATSVGTEMVPIYENVRLPHPTCSKFYEYIQGQMVEKSCAPGTHFNPALEVCDFPEHAGCENSTTTSMTSAIPETTNPEETAPTETSSRSTPGTVNDVDCSTCEFVLLPHPMCSKFYECIHGQMVEKNCAPGTHFNPILEVCDYPDHAGCEKTTTTSTTSAIPETTITEETTLTEIFTPWEETTLHMKTTIPEVTAPPATSEGTGNTEMCPIYENVRLPHPTCSKFYEYIQGQMVEKSCAPGTHFNPTLEVCDFPDHAGCENFITTSTTSAIPETTNPQETAPTETSTPSEETTSPIKTTIPEEKASTEISTPWEETTLPMNTIIPGETAHSESSPPPKETAPSTETTIPEETAHPEKSSRSTPGAVNAVDCSTGGFVLLPHPMCSKFYECIHGQVVKKNCAPGTHFNPALEVCDYPDHAGCENSTTTSTTSAIPETTNSEETATTEASSRSTPGAVNVVDCSTGEFVLLPHPMCSKFYECIHGQMVERNCAPGTHFNPALEVCDYPEHAGCENSTTTSMTSIIPETTILEEIVPTETSTLPEVTTSFMKTTIPEETVLTVSSTLPKVTTSLMETTIPEETVPTETSTLPKVTTSLMETTIPEVTVPTESSTLPKVTTSLMETTIPEATTPAEHRKCDGFHKETSPPTDEDDYPDTKPKECLPGDSEEYFMPDPKHCNRFYLCSKGMPVPLNCPKGLYFNTKSMVCDFAAQNEDPKQEFNEKAANKAPNQKLLDGHPNRNQNNDGVSQVKGRKISKSHSKHYKYSQKTTYSNYYDVQMEKYKAQYNKYFASKSSHFNKRLKTSQHKG